MSSQGRDFSRTTRQPESDETRSDQDRGLPQPPLTNPPPDSLPRHPLPPPTDYHLSPLDFFALLNQRRTLRDYAPEPLSLLELSCLLWATQGIKEVTSRPSTLRPVPSAGARHPFETYLLINRVESLATGMYQYAALDHELARITVQPTIADQVTAACMAQEHVRESAVTFIWAADAYRTIWRYPERANHYIHIDAGHVCQNLYLTAEALGCGVCAIGAFDDAAMNTIVGLDGENHFVVYCASLGKR